MQPQVVESDCRQDLAQAPSARQESNTATHPLREHALNPGANVLILAKGLLSPASQQGFVSRLGAQVSLVL